MQLKLSGNLKYVLQKLKTKKFPITVKCLTQYAHKNQTEQNTKSTRPQKPPVHQLSGLCTANIFMIQKKFGRKEQKLK